jgi:putative transposase
MSMALSRRRPRWSAAQIANVLKGSTSRYLRKRFPELKRICGRDQVWTQTSDVATAGQVAAETIRRSIEECQGKGPLRGWPALIPIP